MSLLEFITHIMNVQLHKEVIDLFASYVQAIVVCIV